MIPGPKGGQGAAVSLANAVAAWGEDMPGWVRRLAEAADATSQGAIAKRLGYSGSVVNQVLKRTYKGDLAAVEKAVNGALMGDTLECPVVGEMAAHTCLEHQKRARGPLQATSALRVALYRACRSGTCPHSRTGRPG